MEHSLNFRTCFLQLSKGKMLQINAEMLQARYEEPLVAQTIGWHLQSHELISLSSAAAKLYHLDVVDASTTKWSLLF